MPKPTLFTAASPFTGQLFTRRSLRPYTHAVIYHTPAAALRAGEEARKATLIREAEDYRLIAEAIEAGGEPAADSPLRTKRAHTSWQEQMAGVRSVWDQVRYTLEGRSVWGPISREELAAKYRGYERRARNHAEELDPAAISAPREEATFHHSMALASKKASGIPGTAIVEAVA